MNNWEKAYKILAYQYKAIEKELSKNAETYEIYMKLNYKKRIMVLEKIAERSGL
jgi:hypothetical protein